MGLLAPARVNAGSGYRCCIPEQACDALTIALLREMGLPPAVIAQAPAAGPERGAHVREACLVGQAGAPQEELMTRPTIPVQEHMA